MQTKSSAILAIIALLIPLLLPLHPAPTRAASDFAAIDEFVQARMDEARVPGLAIAIVQDDQIIYTKGYGRTGSGQPVTPQTPFMIASLTKSFTALAIMQLVEQGQLDLDAPVQRYLPWFRVADPAASAQITLRHLLYHTSGLAQINSLPAMLSNDNSPIALEQSVRALATIPLARPVGASFEYSNINYQILGLIVQTVAGQPYEDYIEQHIFTPLAMHHSYTSKTQAAANLAPGAQWWFGIPIPAHLPYSRSVAPAGGLIASAEDMAHYLIAHLNDGCYTDACPISPASLEQLHRPGASSDAEHSYAMGWSVGKIANVTTLNHDGGMADYQAMMILAPQSRLGVIVLTNVNGLFQFFTRMVAFETARGILALMLDQTPVPQSKPTLTSAYIIADLIIAFITWQALRLLLAFPRWYKRFAHQPPTTTSAWSKMLIQIAILHAWPLELFILAPLFTGFPRWLAFWPWLALWLPDITYWLAALMALTTLKGAVQFALVISLWARIHSNMIPTTETTMPGELTPAPFDFIPASHSDFQMTVEDVFSISRRGTVVTGRIESGAISTGAIIQITGAHSHQTTVLAIEMFRKTVTTARAGDNVGLLLQDITRDQVQRGDVLRGM